MPITDILSENYDRFISDENGDAVYDKPSKVIAYNLLNYEWLDSTGYRTYDEFFNAVTNGTVGSNNDFSCDLLEDIVNKKSGVEAIRKINEFITRKPGKPRYTGKSVFGLPKGCKSGYRYVNSVLTREIWQSWQPGEQIFISAGTGRGKNTFIKKELLKHCGNQKVVIFENRESLMQQQVMDIVSEIDPEALKYSNITEDNMVIFGRYKNIMIISYQYAAKKCMLADSNFYNFCSQARYLIFDEAHYILDDAGFNKGISFFVRTFLYPVLTKDANNNDCKIPSFSNATKIFMSGTMEEIYEYVQTIAEFSEKPVDIIQEKEMLAEKNGFNSRGFLGRFGAEVNKNLVLSFPTDYSYIIPFKYKKYDDICNCISETSADDKWLIFVNSIEDGIKLQSALTDVCGETVKFLSAENKNSEKNKELYNQLIHNSRFDCRVLIATTVIYNGVNIKDERLKHIVIPFSTISVVKQLIGRKRMGEGETVNVYFPDVNYRKVKKHYCDCIRDCIEIMNLSGNLYNSALCQLNGLVDSSSKYYYLSPPDDFYIYHTSIYSMNVLLNYPAIYKLYYDICFYIFTLQRMNPELEDKSSDFIKILLTHLDIEEKYIDVTDITVSTHEEILGIAKRNLTDFLEKTINCPVVVPDINGLYEDMLEFKRLINETYKILHDGKSFDTQWKNKDRFFSNDRLKSFLAELLMPYEITSEGSKEKRTITVVKK